MAIGTALTNAYVHISCAMQACELFAWRDRPQALRHVHGLSRFLPSLRELGAKQALDILEERPLAPIWRGEGLPPAARPTVSGGGPREDECIPTCSIQ